MNGKRILVYFVSFLSLSLIFTGGYYFSYKKALEEFNRTAKERNNQLVLTLEDKGLIIVQKDVENTSNTDSSKTDDGLENTSNFNNDGSHGSSSNGGSKVPSGDIKSGENSQEVDNIKGVQVLPTTKYIMQTYDVITGEKTDETLQMPSYLVGLNRDEIIEYLDSYMKDLPWNEFKAGLTAYELLLFSDKEIIIRKTYNSNLVQYEYFIQSIDGNIVVFYSDQKTVHEFTSITTENLSQEERLELEEGCFITDLDELYAVLENYTS